MPVRKRRVLMAVVAMAVGASAPAAPALAEAQPGRGVAVCGPVPSGYARCLAEVLSGPAAEGVSAAGAPAGLSPKRLKKAYGFPEGDGVGQGQTIAIVSAFDAPTVEQDLKKFSKEFGLPACGTGNGCFTKTDRFGGTDYPAPDTGWALESTLDVEWAHAIAPGAKIVLVEGVTNNFGNLMAALVQAGTVARYVSNSWGGTEVPLLAIFEPLFTQFPMVSYFAGSGDTGLGAFYPASSPNVIAVGGTSVTLNNDGSLKKELGWSGSGGGCSGLFAASASQLANPTVAQVGCGTQRAIPDVAAVGDPTTGAAVYATASGGWVTVGGTSLATPIIAARAAGTGAVVNEEYLYGGAVAFRDITQGNNGAPCLDGFDLVTGQGRWKR
jgi:subtilase family serine protease